MSSSQNTEDDGTAAAREKAQALFRAGYNCAQSVAAPFAKELGYDEKTVFTLIQAFGGGMSRMREVCGTVCGMLMAAGMAEGNDLGDKETKDKVYAIGQQLAAEFKKDHGSIICRELLGLVPMGQSEIYTHAGKSTAHNFDSPVSSERTDSYYKKRPCEQLCGDAAVILRKWLNSRKTATGEK